MSSQAPTEPLVGQEREVTPANRKVFIEQIAATANAMIGIPYCHLGRDHKVGLDCYGLVLDFYRRFGLPLQEVNFNYELQWWRTRNYVAEHDQDFYKVKDPTPGGIVAIKSDESLVPNHLAVVIDNKYLLNMSDRIGAHRLRIFAVRSYIVVSYQRRGLLCYS